MKKSNVIGLTIGIVVVIVTVSLICWFAIKPVPTLIQGEVEVKSIKISSKLAGRIEQMDVKEGQQVKKGELLFVLSTPEVEAKLRQAEAARNAAGAQSAKASRGARIQEIEGALNMWKKAQAGVELAQKSFDRVKNLYESGVVPAQKYDEALANLKAMQTTESAAKAQYDMAVEGARREDREAAAALVDQASGAVSEVESYISDAMQYSPIDGEVSSVIAEKGELIGSGYPVITLLDMNDLWITFNIKEDLLPKIRIGSVLKAYVPGLGGAIELKVDYIAVQAEYATWSATRTKGDFDIRTFEVKARPVAKVDGLRPGMTVRVNWDDFRYIRGCRSDGFPAAVRVSVRRRCGFKFRKKWNISEHSGGYLSGKSGRSATTRSFTGFRWGCRSCRSCSSSCCSAAECRTTCR